MVSVNSDVMTNNNEWHAWWTAKVAIAEHFCKIWWITNVLRTFIPGDHFWTFMPSGHFWSKIFIIELLNISAITDDNWNIVPVSEAADCILLNVSNRNDFILVQKLYRATIYKQCYYSVVTDVEILIWYEHGYVIYRNTCAHQYIFLRYLTEWQTKPLTFLNTLVGLTSKQLNNSSVFRF